MLKKIKEIFYKIFRKEEVLRLEEKSNDLEKERIKEINDSQKREENKKVDFKEKEDSPFEFFFKQFESCKKYEEFKNKCM